MHSFGEIRAINVRNEPEGHAALAVMLERLVGHHGSEVGAANADVDDVADALACVSFPLPAPYAIRELSHLVQDPVNLGHYVLAVNDDGSSFGRAKGHVQDRPLLSGVNLLPSKHGVNPRFQPRFFAK